MTANRIAHPAALVFATIAMVALALAVAGCGESSTATGGGLGSGTPQQCGTINRGGPLAATAAPGGDQRALDCFWHAHTACAPATLPRAANPCDPASAGPGSEHAAAAMIAITAGRARCRGPGLARP